MEPIEKVVERAELAAEAEFQREQMSVCEQAGYHVFALGRPTCRCGEQMPPGVPVRD
jgi:hypothetical protein